MVAWRYEIPLLVSKKIFHSFAALTRETSILQHSKRNFVSPRGGVISSISYLFMFFSGKINLFANQTISAATLSFEAV